MNTDHLKIHKETGIEGSSVYHYLVNTYYDYTLTHYFQTRKQAQAFVEHCNHMDKLGLEDAR